MYDEIFNPDDFESEILDNFEGSFEEVLDIEIPTPKERLSLDELMRKYGFIIFKEWPKTTKQGVKK